MAASIGNTYSQLPGILNATTLEAVKQAPDRDHIGSLLERLTDKIKDWFFNTDTQELKKILYDFISDQSSDQEKIEGFLKLRGDAGQHHKTRFHFETIDLGKYSLQIDLGDGEKLQADVSSINIHLNDFTDRIDQEKVLSELKSMPEPIDEKASQFEEGQFFEVNHFSAAPFEEDLFQKDITRHNGKYFHVNGEDIEIYTTRGFTHTAKEQGFNDAEIRAVRKVAHQGTWAEVLKSVPEAPHNITSIEDKSLSEEKLQLVRNDSGEAVLRMEYTVDCFSRFQSHEEAAELANTFALISDNSPVTVTGLANLKVEVTISSNGDIKSTLTSMKVGTYMDS